MFRAQSGDNEPAGVSTDERPRPRGGDSRRGPARHLLALFLFLAVFTVLAAASALASPAQAEGRDRTAITPASITTGKYPEGVAISPDGAFALVVNYGANTVSRIRTSDNAVVATIPVGNWPASVAIAPDSAFALVTNLTNSSVSRIRLSDNTVTATISVGSGPADVAIAPNAMFAYVTNSGSNSVSRIRTSDNAVTATIPVAAGPIGIVIAPDSSFAYVAESQAASVSRIRTSDNTKVATTSVGVAGIQPLYMAMAPDGTFAYVIKGADFSLSRIRTSDNSLVASVGLGSGGVQGLAISHDGTFAYVTLNASGSLARVRTSDNTVTATFTVGSGPFGVAIAPNDDFAYVSRTVAGLVMRVEAPTTPPTNLVATPGNGQASIAFNAPQAGDIGLTNYQYSINDGATWVTRSPASTATPLVVTGLTNKASYTIRLRALNPVGTGPQSTSVTVVPTPTPGTPTLTSVVPGPGSVTVNFNPPADNGGVPPTNYQYSLDNGTTWITRSPAGTTSPMVLTGLTNGTHAKVKLRALNAAGVGTATPTVTATVGSIPVGTRPSAVAFGPDGSFAYVVNRGASTVSRVRTADDREVATIAVGSLPSDVAISADGSLAYVTNRGDNTVSAISTATNSVIGTYPVGSLPVAVVFAPNGAFAYVVNQGVGTVSKVNTATGSVVTSIKVGSWPTDVQIDRAGYNLYVTNGWERNLSKISTGTDAVTSTFGLGESPQVVGDPYAGGPSRLALSRSGSLAYDTSDNGALLTRLNTGTSSTVQTRLSGTPRGVAMSPDETQLLATDEASDTIWRVDPIEMTIGATIHVGLNPTAVAYAPDGSYAYVVNGGEASISRVGVAGAPTSLTATPGNGSASVAFAPPASDGGASVTNYKYSMSSNNGVTWSAWTALSPADPSSPVTITGLTNGTAYQVKLRAVTTLGDGVASAPASVTPSTVPSAPTITAATGGVRQISVAFTAPADNGGAALTTYEYSLGGGTWTPRSPASTFSPVVIPGLADGTTYSIRLRAVNAAGPGTPSVAYSSATLPRLAAPTALAATPGNGTADITFTAPASPPSAPITNYKFSLSTNSGGTWGAWTATAPADAISPLTIPGLVNGTTYLVRLLAVNDVGDGASSAAVPVTPCTVPSAPTSLVATMSGDGTATLAFTAPATDGGAAISNYAYSRSTDGGGTWSDWTALSPARTTSPVVIAGMVEGTAYQFKLRAMNVAGAGPESLPSAGVTAGPPGMVLVPVDPARVVDTRLSQQGSGPLAAGTSGMRVFSVAQTQAGQAPVVPPGATAIAYNLTVPNPTTAGHVRVMPGDASELTSASAINYRIGETIANGLVVTLDNDRHIKVYVSTSADVIIDVLGYFVPAAPQVAPVARTNTSAVSGARFNPITPIRVYDARSDTAGALPGYADRLVSTAATQDGSTPVVPTGASAVAYNITAVSPRSGGLLRVMPGDVASTSASAINWSMPGDVIANGLTVRLDTQRQLRVYNGTPDPVTFLIDVVGYYSASGALFYPTDPVRVLDTRSSRGGEGAIVPGATAQRTASVAAAAVGGAEQVPLGAVAIAYNLTATNTTAYGHLRVFPAGLPRPDASTINWPGAGYSRANGTVVAISPDRQVTLYNGSTGPTDALIDTLGYYR